MSEANAIWNAVKAVDDEMRRLRSDLAEAQRLLMVAFGEYACAASKYLPEDEKSKFETNFAVPARTFLARSTTNDK